MKGVREFFENRYRELNQNRPRLDEVNFRSLSENDRRQLEESFDVEEIKLATWECEGSKSPSPDGLNVVFIKMY